MISARIAIVEDDADLRRVLLESLKEEEFEVLALAFVFLVGGWTPARS